MPYGSLGAEKLSQASRIGLEKAADWWQKSMQTSSTRPTSCWRDTMTMPGRKFICASKRAQNAQRPRAGVAQQHFEVSANNEVGLAQKITHVRDLPIETITVFVESRNAVSVKSIFKRKFGKTLQIRKFKADFEFDHQMDQHVNLFRLVLLELAPTGLVRAEKAAGLQASARK